MLIVRDVLYVLILLINVYPEMFENNVIIKTTMNVDLYIVLMFS